MFQRKSFFVFKNKIPHSDVFWLLLSLFSSSVFYLLASSYQHSVAYPTPISWNQHASYNHLVSCFGDSRIDGAQCLLTFARLYKEELSLEEYPEIIYNHYKSCIESREGNSEGAMAFNVLHCIQEAGSNAMRNGSQYSLFKTFGTTIAIYLSLLVQATVVLRFVTSILPKKENSIASRSETQIFDIKMAEQKLRAEVSEISISLRSEIKNIQGRLNRGGDVRREFEKIHRKLFDLHTTHGIRGMNNINPPFTSHPYTKYPELSLHSSMGPIIDNRNGFVRPHFKYPEFHSAQPLIERPIMKVNGPVSADPPMTRRDKMFDITDPIGRTKFKEYVKSNTSQSQVLEEPIVKFGDIKVTTPSTILKGNHKPSVKFGFDGSENLQNISENKKVSFSPTSKKSSPSRSLSYINPNSTSLKTYSAKEVGKNAFLPLTDQQQMETVTTLLRKVDKNGRPYKRIFVPGQGWTSAKRLVNSDKPVFQRGIRI